MQRTVRLDLLIAYFDGNHRTLGSAITRFYGLFHSVTPYNISLTNPITPTVTADGT